MLCLNIQGSAVDGCAHVLQNISLVIHVHGSKVSVNYLKVLSRKTVIFDS